MLSGNIWEVNQTTKKEGKHLKKEDLINLKIEPEENGLSIQLDDKKMHHVEKYKIEQATLPGTARLTIEMLVKYP